MPVPILSWPQSWVFLLWADIAGMQNTGITFSQRLAPRFWKANTPGNIEQGPIPCTELLIRQNKAMKVKPKLQQDCGTSAEESYRSRLKRELRYTYCRPQRYRTADRACWHSSATIIASRCWTWNFGTGCLWCWISILLYLSSLLSRSSLLEWECFFTAIVYWKFFTFSIDKKW